MTEDLNDTLDLGDNDLTRDEVRDLAERIRTTKTLRELDLEDAGLDDDSIEILAQALRRNTSITYIDLSDNNFTERGLMALSVALDTNTSLLGLNLEDNLYESEELEVQIAACLSRNARIHDRLRQLNFFSTNTETPEETHASKFGFGG